MVIPAFPMTEKQFLEDVDDYRPHVLLDEGVQRNIVFADPNNDEKWFGLMTWHNYLCFYGDHGVFAFRRVPDMYKFFRNDPLKPLEPNYGYWAEKVDATDVIRGHIEFDTQKFIDAVNDIVSRFVARVVVDDVSFASPELAADYAAALLNAVDRDVLSVVRETESEDFALEAVDSFMFEGHPILFSFHLDHFGFDTNTTYKRYTERFVWACYAIQWGIRQHDVIYQQSSGYRR